MIYDTPNLVESLTPREKEVLLSVSKGLTNKEIAERLNIVETTVWTHLSNIYGKLGVRNRTEATRWALQNLTIVPEDT